MVGKGREIRLPAMYIYTRYFGPICTWNRKKFFEFVV